jgi:hypothetical protein
VADHHEHDLAAQAAGLLRLGVERLVAAAEVFEEAPNRVAPSNTPSPSKDSRTTSGANSPMAAS